MEMTLQNSTWHSKQEVKIADYGENLIQKEIEPYGYVFYKPVSDSAHLIDGLALQGKEFKFGIEVKTKPKFKKYPATGFDYRHYCDYIKFTEQQELPLFVFFVDEELGKIYGNFLHVLDEPREYCGMKYPGTFWKNGRKIRYYPMSAMVLIRDLTESEISNLKSLRSNCGEK